VTTRLLPIPAGTTWDDVTGRTWSVVGDGLLLGIPPSPRQVLQEWLQGVLRADVYVIDYPPEVVAPVAVVIRPADPYQAPYTASGAAGKAWAFEVDIVVGRNLPNLGLTRLELLQEQIVQNLPPGWRWLEFGGVGEIIVADKTYLKGTLGLAVASPGGLDDFELKE